MNFSKSDFFVFSTTPTLFLRHFKSMDFVQAHCNKAIKARKVTTISNEGGGRGLHFKGEIQSLDLGLFLLWEGTWVLSSVPALSPSVGHTPHFELLAFSKQHLHIHVYIILTIPFLKLDIAYCCLLILRKKLRISNSGPWILKFFQIFTYKICININKITVML